MNENEKVEFEQMCSALNDMYLTLPRLFLTSLRLKQAANEIWVAMKFLQRVEKFEIKKEYTPPTTNWLDNSERRDLIVSYKELLQIFALRFWNNNEYLRFSIDNALDKAFFYLESFLEGKSENEHNFKGNKYLDIEEQNRFFREYATGNFEEKNEGFKTLQEIKNPLLDKSDLPPPKRKPIDVEC